MSIKEIYFGKDKFTHKQFWAWLATIVVVSMIFKLIF